MDRVAQSVQRLTAGWTVRGSNPGVGRGRFSALVQTDPGAHPAFCTLGTGSFLGVNSGRGVTLTPHPFLVPWSWKGRAIPLLPLWAVRPVQSLSACTRVKFSFTLSSQRGEYGELLIMPSNGRWDLIRRLTFRCLMSTIVNVPHR